LLEQIHEFGQHVAIAGFRNTRIDDVEELLERVYSKKPLNVEIQFFDAKAVATWQHLYFAVLNALKAFKNKENISKSLAMETVLYGSAQHQIRKAMEILGIKPGTSNVALLVVGEESETVESTVQMISEQLDSPCDDTVLELSKGKVAQIKKTFGISDLELRTVMKKGCLQEALTNLVIERMALLATQR
jgi:tRNA threonylcarbamoyladenosine modification (KEOPS) complex Cgi121 subunit